MRKKTLMIMEYSDAVVDDEINFNNKDIEGI